ncbi:MAG: alanyl-tRNA editing protein [Haloferacaceae archaeon]
MRSLAPAEPGTREFEATVRRVDGREVVLDETYFYPEGGGQPADRGTVDGVRVAHVRTGEDGVVHELAEAPSVGAGETVVGVVDDAFRTYCMRAHTASHALFGAGRRLCDDLGYGGFGIDDEKVRVDLRTPTDVDDDLLVELERLTNRAVWDSRAVSWERVPVDEARARKDVAFNTRTEEGVMADADAVRLVTIEDWDVAACGGTHVANTREIGPVTVLDRSNPGEGLTRVEFAVGPPGIERRATVHRAALDAARELGTNVASLAEGTAALRAERDDLAEEVAELKDEVLASRLAGLEAVERDGRRWRVGAVEGFGPNEVGDRVRGRAGDGEAVAVAGDADGTAFVVVATGGDPDAAAVVDDVTDEFGGGGGGSDAFAQGGGIPADPAEVADYLRD